MTSKTKPRTLKVQQAAAGSPFVKVSVQDLGLRKGDYVQVSVSRLVAEGAVLRMRKTKKPKAKAKAKKPRKRPQYEEMSRQDWIDLVRQQQVAGLLHELTEAGAQLKKPKAKAKAKAKKPRKAKPFTGPPVVS